jgi:ribosomal protein S18 acetylase RimI-like enzyme
VSKSADFPYTARQQRWWFATHDEQINIAREERSAQRDAFKKSEELAAKFKGGDSAHKREGYGFQSAELIGSGGGQKDFQIQVSAPGGKLGAYASYSVYDGEVHIKMVEVGATHRRRGIGLELLKQIAREHPGLPIRSGMRTQEGEQLWRSWRAWLALNQKQVRVPA